MHSSKGSFLGYIKTHFFSLSIIVLLLLLLGGSYVRFVVMSDYLITFEGECDPYTESCYEGCEDEACSEIYYYNLIERHAAETFNRCGTGNVLECDAAWECQDDAEDCSITYCDQEIDGSDTCIRLTKQEL